MKKKKKKDDKKTQRQKGSKERGKKEDKFSSEKILNWPFTFGTIYAILVWGFIKMMDRKKKSLSRYIKTAN